MLTKISEIVVSDIIDYLRISETSEKEEKYLKTILNVSKEYIRKYTGYDKIEDLDKYPDLVIVVFVLCQSMYDDRAYYIDNTNVNKVVQSILDLHSRNLLL
nr:MAG TPA: head tail connector [Caudoviricetes sp.]